VLFALFLWLLCRWGFGRRAGHVIA
jgi:hypothetical protein